MSTSEPKQKFALPSRYTKDEESVWTEYVQLATEYKPVNLGQGFPNFPPSKFVTDALVEVATNPENSVHQYTRGFGHPRLVKVLSKIYSKLIGRDINPFTEIVATLGAYNALFAAIMGHVDSGDEVIIMEPFFECYEHNVISAGGVPRFIPLKLKTELVGVATSSDWTFEESELENLFNDKTKAIIINTPHNPLGKIFSYSELEFIADLCKKWNVLCICDEVYEWLIYGGKDHIRMASLPDMWERTITIGSGGKTFGVTGWKLGWAYGPEHLIHNLHLVHHNCVRAGNTILQEAAAICFEKILPDFGEDKCYFRQTSKDFEKKRDFMFGFLTEMGLKPTLPDGGYFMVVDWTPIENSIDLTSEKDKYKDYRFTKWLTKNVGVQGIPPSAFYTEKDKHLGENFVRFCFVKTDDYLNQASDILKKWKSEKLKQHS